VGEVLALEINGPSDALGEPVGVVEGRWPPGKVAQQEIQLGTVLGILPRVDPGPLQLIEGWH
jgi:hypothetical protein